MTLLELLGQDGIKVRRIGKFYRARCPWHNGKTTTSLMIDQENNTYHCHGCGKHGDTIQYLRDTRGLSFFEACAELGVEPKRHQQTRKDGFEPRKNGTPNLQWQGRAENFLKETIESLWHTSQALSFLHDRGLRDDTIKASCLGWNSRDRYEDREAWGLDPETDEKGKIKELWLPRGLVIPLIDSISEELHAVLRLRIRRPSGEPRYYIVSGSDTRPMVFHPDRECFVIVESGVDGFLINQESGDLIGTIALGSVSIKPDEETHEALKRAGLILISLDFDEAGGKASWDFWTRTYPSARRWPVPIGKDPSEAFQGGMSVRAWVEAGLTKQTSYLQNQRLSEDIVRPFPKEWLQKFNEEQLERLAIMTIDGRLSDQEAVSILN